MNVSYRVFQEENGQYVFREVFAERDGQIIAYSRNALTPVSGSLDELADEVASLQEAISQPVLTTRELDAIIAQGDKPVRQTRKPISHAELLAKLGLDTDEQVEISELSVAGQRN